MNNNFIPGDEVTAYFTEHSIPTHLDGVVVSVIKDLITVRATDGWEGEAGSRVTVPYYNAKLKEGHE